MKGMKSITKTILWILVINILFVVFFALLRHAWYMTEMGEAIKTVYPRFYFLLIPIGSNAPWIFAVAFPLMLLLNIYILFSIISHYRGTKTAILFFFSVTISLFIGANFLRVWDKNRALTRFFVVDDLIEYKSFTADENGIVRVDSASATKLSESILKNSSNLFSREIDAHEILRLSSEHRKFIKGEVKNDLYKLYIGINQKPQNSRTEWETAVLNYLYHPINENGFRSISFKKYKRDKPSVLLLGDSFTWGHSADNATNSFADILLSMGYVVYNTGITGSDVAQYLAVAQKYISELQPDFVIVNFYLGNDVSYYKREPKPHQPFIYHTNAGLLMGCPHGKYLTKEEAYHLALEHYDIPIDKTNFIGKWLLKSSTGRWAMKTLQKSYLTPYLFTYKENKIAAYYAEVEKQKTDLPYSNQELNEIKTLAEQHNSKFILAVIPWRDNFFDRKTKDFPDLFGGLPFHEMNADKTDYFLKDGHFNNKGHQRYAAFLDSLIRNY